MIKFLNTIHKIRSECHKLNSLFTKQFEITAQITVVRLNDYSL